MNYRKLNDITIKNRYSLSLMKKIRIKLARANWFTKLDLKNAFHQIRMKKEEEWKTVFRTRQRLFEYQMMLFELANASITFQSVINTVLEKYLDDFAMTYLNDILIYFETTEKHKRDIIRVLQKLKENNLKLSLKKCIFAIKKVKYLKFILSSDHIQMNSEKVKAITDWFQSESKKDVQSFLDLAEFYHKIVSNYAWNILSMLELLNKDIKWIWTKEYQKFFESCKRIFSSASIIKFFDSQLDTIVETDFSDDAIKECLTQLHKNENRYSVVYCSRNMQTAEVNYDIHDKELLIIVYCCKEWRVQLQRTKKKFIIYSDHKNLLHFISIKQLTRRQAKWSELLREYNFTLKHVSEEENDRANALNRRSNYDESKQVIKTLFKQQDTMLKLANISTISSEDKNQRIWNVYSDEDRELLEDSEKNEYTVRNELLSINNRIYVSKKIRNDFIREYHNESTQEHQDINKTWKKIARKYYFSRMRISIFKYIDKCLECNQNKKSRERKQDLLQSLNISTISWNTISLNFIVKLSSVTNVIYEITYDSILMMIDKLTKYVVMISCNEAMNSITFSKILIKEIISKFKFVSNFWFDLLKALESVKRMSIVFHSEFDEQIERTNQTLEQYLRMYIDNKEKHWARLLSTAIMTYNDTESKATDYTLYFANFDKNMSQIENNDTNNSTIELKVNALKLQ